MKELCANCQSRPAEIDWVGEGGTLAWVHGMFSRWCLRCATEAQLKHARETAARIPELEQKLAGLS